jgi:hypothetical protein
LRKCTIRYLRDLLAEGRLIGAKKIRRQWQIPIAALAKRNDS